MEKFMREIKNKYEHYFRDEHGKKQGEYKNYYHNNQLCDHFFYKDNKKHGECKVYNLDGSLDYIKYYSNGNDITDMYNKLNVWKSL